MKIQPEHFALMQDAVSAVDLEVHRTAYKAGNFHGAAACKDKDKRYRWDLLRVALIEGRSGIRWACDVLYPYVDDAHIDTALRRIVPALES